MCKIHENRPIEYYCEDDDMIICSRCVIVGSHKGHNISSIEDKVGCNRLCKQKGYFNSFVIEWALL